MKRVIAVLIAAVLAHPALAQEAAAPQEQDLSVRTAQHRDWGVRCLEQPDGTVVQCIGLQEFRLSDAPENTAPFMSARLGFAQSKEDGAPRAVLEIVLPLGVSLVPGVKLSVDGKPVADSPFAQCTQTGCSALFPLEEPIEPALRAGSKAVVTFTDAASLSHGVPVSLLGFSAALEAVRKP